MSLRYNDPGPGSGRPAVASGDRLDEVGKHLLGVARRRGVSLAVPDGQRGQGDDFGEPPRRAERSVRIVVAMPETDRAGRTPTDRG